MIMGKASGMRAKTTGWRFCIAAQIGRALARGAGAAAGVAAAASLVLSADHARADEGTAVLIGGLVDASSAAKIGDAVVTVTSPSLQGEQVVVTDASGLYRLPNLPPGIYTVRVDKEGYRPYVRGDIHLRADSTIRVNAQLLPEAIGSEEVVVVGQAPTVDVGSSGTTTTISYDFTSRIPLASPSVKGSAVRSFESVATVAPGARDDAYGVSISGASSPENGYLIDGLSVNNPAVGLIGTPLSIEFIKEVNVLSAGYMPEYGRATGGILDATTKSGSNSFHGSVFTYLTPGGLEGHRKDVLLAGTTIETSPSLSYMADFGADVGGPIIKDKLWFYAGFDIARTKYDLRRQLNRLVIDANGNQVLAPDGSAQVEPLPNTSALYHATSQNIQAIAKLDYAADQDNKLTLEFITNPYSSGGNGNYGINPLTGTPEIGTQNTLAFPALVGPYSALAHEYFGSSTNLIAKWSTQADNKRTSVDTTFGWFHAHGGRAAGDGSTVGSSTGYASISNVYWYNQHSITEVEQIPDPALCTPPANVQGGITTLCPVTGYHTGGAEYLDDQNLNRYQLRSTVTRLVEAAGHHVLKAGIDLSLSTFEHLQGYAGGRDVAEYPGAPFFIDGREFGYLSGPDQAVIYPTQHTTTKNVIVGGFVQDSWNVLDMITLNLGLRYDAQFMYAGDGSRSISLPNEWSPRLGAIYDFTHDGRSRIYANYARYYEGVPLDVMERGAGGQSFIALAYDPSKCDPHNPATTCRGTANALPIGDAPNQYYVPFAQGKAAIDPDLRPPSSDEIVGGVEYEIIPKGRLGASYTHRWLSSVVEDMSRDEGRTAFIGNPGSGIASDFPKAERIYDAATLYFTKIFSQEWLAQASYTISYLRGNYSGLFRPEDLQLNPHTNSDFDLRELLVNRSGPLPGDNTHAFKLFAAKDTMIPGGYDLLTGIGFRGHSGEPTNRLGASAVSGYYDQVFIDPRGSDGRLPWVFSFDLKLGYGIHLDKDTALTLTMDVFNLFNFQSVTARDPSYTKAPVQPTRGPNGQLLNPDGTDFNGAINPNFGRPTEYQPPRVFRFGLKATF